MCKTCFNKITILNENEFPIYIVIINNVSKMNKVNIFKYEKNSIMNKNNLNQHIIT